jgi:hypothetical protein
LVSVRQSHYFSRLSSARLTKTTRYWGHEHDYRNNLISVRWGGVVPREIPCNRRESETLRDGPFSNFRQTSSEKGTAGKPSLKDKQGKEKALSEAGDEEVEGKKGQADQASEATGTRIDGQSTRDDEDDRDEGVDVEANDLDSETEQDAAEDEDELAQEEDDEAQPSRWQSDVLCVVDPFIRGKVERASYSGHAHILSLSD